MIIPRNHQKPAVHAVSCSGQSILIPGGPSAISRAKWIKKPGHYSGQHGPVPPANSRGTGNDKHGGKGMRDRALVLVPSSPG